MKLVDDWRRAWRWPSVHISAIGAVLMGVAEVAGSSWAALPPDIRANIPHAQTIALVLFLLQPIARVLTKEGNPMANKRILFGGTGALGAAVAIILTGVYKDEGDYVNHPSDPGGETNLGVTATVAREEGYRGTMRAFPKQCFGPEDVCGDKIYFERYMQRPGYLPIIAADPAVGEELVNSAVNFGPARPSRWLQQSINQICPASKLAVDGKVGPATTRGFVACQAKFNRVVFCRQMLDQMDGRQRVEYDRLVSVNPRLKVFHRGWINHRIGNVDRRKCA